MLQTDPELVHLDKVGQDERDRVLQVSSRPKTDVSPSIPELFSGIPFSPIAIPDRKVIPRQPAQIMPQEQPTRRMLYSSRHLHHILHDLLDGRIGDRHIDGADGDHEVETGNDVS